MKIERDERRFDFHDIGLAIKRAREASGMTQEQLAYIVDRAPRTIMYNENDGQHPSLNTFYQMVTMFDISVDQYFYPSKNKGSECRKRIDAMLNALDEKELKIVEATIQAMKAAIRLIHVVAPKVIPLAVLLIKPPRHIGIRGPAIFPQGKTALIVKQDRAADHIALIFFQNNTSLDAPPPLDKVSRSGGGRCGKHLSKIRAGHRKIRPTPKRAPESLDTSGFSRA